MWNQMPHRYYGWDGGWDGGWHMLWHGGLTLLVLVLIVFGVVLIVRAVSSRGENLPPPAREPQRHNALEILDARYARGEIDRDEYLARKKDLTEHA